LSEPAIYLLVGLLASVPLTVAVNLATPRLERWWASLSAAKARSLAAKDRELSDRARRLRADPEEQVKQRWIILLNSIWLVRARLEHIVLLLFAGFVLLLLGLAPSGPPSPFRTLLTWLIVGLVLFVTLVYLRRARARSSEIREAIIVQALAENMTRADEAPTGKAAPEAPD
jgi:hypothetical protein